MEQASARPTCEHYWASVHEPGHHLYWIRQCMICHRIDWDDLDEQIQKLPDGPIVPAQTFEPSTEAQASLTWDINTTHAEPPAGKDA